MREFWELTPAETMGVLRAWAWREERAQERLAWQVWHIAALQRTKRLPALARLLRRKPKKLSAKGLAKRRDEHAAMVGRYRNSTQGRRAESKPQRRKSRGAPGDGGSEQMDRG